MERPRYTKQQWLLIAAVKGEYMGAILRMDRQMVTATPRGLNYNLIVFRPEAWELVCDTCMFRT